MKGGIHVFFPSLCILVPSFFTSSDSPSCIDLCPVGGTSDTACKIEAMLHELSLERNRLKHEQMKLERLSAGLMIDLQSSLLTSDDNVVVPAPEGLLPPADSGEEGCPKKKVTMAKGSVDDIDVSSRSRSVLTPPRGGGPAGSQGILEQRSGDSDALAHRQIRTSKSHSPGRSGSSGGGAAAATGRGPRPPPSPPYGQVTSNVQSHGWSSVNTPTRVDFRTGLSGHRALTSSHSHPHDFIDRGNASVHYYDQYNPHYRTVRSMSNHAGISTSGGAKKPASSRGRSIY